MSDGYGCTCAAYSQSECACDADWTPQEIYDLRDKVKELEAMNNVTRFEVIDQKGRSYVHYLDKNESIRYSLQDADRTLKVFIDAKKGDNL